MKSDSVDAFDPFEFVEAIRRGRLYGTTGPIVEVTLEGAGPGDTFAGSSGVLRGVVRSAPWVSVSELRVYLSGVLLETRALERDQRFQIPLRFDADAFVTLEVRGEITDDFSTVLPGFVPFAFTNPIWVDAE